MRFQFLECFLLAGLAYGQAVQPSTSLANGGKTETVASTAADSAPEIKVGVDDAVITMNGFCARPVAPDDACKTLITRAQFERLTAALQPDMSLSLRLSMANSYARNLRMSAAAEKRGLDKTPAFEEEMRYARAQLLAQDLNRALQAEANNITDSDFEDYYKKHESSYEQATVARIYVPRAKIADAGSADARSAASSAAEDAMTKVAANLRARAVNGEDPDKLQIEAYAEAGIQGTTSNTKMEKVRRDTLPPRHETVLDLKPGEVSEVFSDPAGAHFIYKMISKEILRLEEVRTEVRGAISSQRYRDSTKSFHGDDVFSDAYFIPPGKPVTPPRRNRRGQGKKPLEGQDEDHD